MNAVDVRSTESATNVTRDELERLPVERDILSVALLVARSDQGRRRSVPRRQLRHLVRWLVHRREHRLYQWTQRHRLLQSRRRVLGAVRLLQGISGQDRRLLGRIRPHDGRRDQCRDSLGHERIRVRLRRSCGSRSSLQSSATDRFLPNGDPYIISRFDEYDRTNATVYASGPIVRDKLFFFALYEARDYEPVNTDNAGSNFFEEKNDDAFWGAKVDWQISDRHLLELLAFSDENEAVSDGYAFSLATGQRGAYRSTTFTDSGGLNWSGDVHGLSDR